MNKHSLQIASDARPANLELNRTREALGDTGRASSVRESELGVVTLGVPSVPSYIQDQDPLVFGLDSLPANL